MRSCAPMLALLSATIPATADDDLLGGIELPENWGWLGESQVYDPETLYEYLNGGAMFYLSYSICTLCVRECVGPEGGSLVVELYTFEPGGDSHGVFLQETRGERPEGPWDDAVYGAGLLKFREGRHVARIQSRRRNDALRAAQLALAARLAEQLNNDDPAPELLRQLRDLLPEGALRPDSERYFHTQESLNSYYYMGTQNVLGLSERTGCVLAEATPLAGTERAIVLVAEYDDAAAAEVARQAVLQHWGLEGAPPAPTVGVRAGDVPWGLLVSERRLGLVLEADSVEAASTAIDQLTPLVQAAENKEADEHDKGR